MSGLIYDLQILTAVIGICHLSILLARGAVRINLVGLAEIAVCAIASIVSFRIAGWRAHSTIHGQGAENLLAFLPVALTSLAVGTYGWRGRRRPRDPIHEDRTGDPRGNHGNREEIRNPTQGSP